jgi:hypothetical protein
VDSRTRHVERLTRREVEEGDDLLDGLAPCRFAEEAHADRGDSGDDDVDRG